MAYWIKQYEKDYVKDTKGKFPIYVDQDGKYHEEKSPYFETLSKILTNRGYLFKKEFVSIASWKSERQKGRYESNSKKEIQNITKKMLEAPDGNKIKVILKLKGVGIPVASAILTTVYPKKFCIIDYRAWRAVLWLKQVVSTGNCSFASYEEYSNFLDTYDSYAQSPNRYYSFRETMKTLGEKGNFTSRQIEMALWKFDQMKGKK